MISSAFCSLPRLQVLELPAIEESLANYTNNERIKCFDSNNSYQFLLRWLITTSKMGIFAWKVFKMWKND